MPNGTLRLTVIALVANFLSVSATIAQPANIAMLKGDERRATLVKGAAAEGKVLFYSGWVADQVLRPMGAAFHSAYPSVEIEFVTGNNRLLFQKLVTEGRAGVNIADVIGDTAIAEPLIQAGLVQPYYTPSADAIPAQFKSPQGYYVSANIYYYGVAYNKRLVKPEAAPKLYEDLLEPRWRGKTTWPSASDSGAPLFIMNILAAKGDSDGEAYLKALSLNKIVNFTGSARAMVDRVGQGEFELSLASFAHHPLISQAVGAPLDVSMMEPVAADINTILLLKNAPHPHAAMLLIDFIFSRDGQAILQKAGYFPTRSDVEPIASMRRIIPTLNNMKMNVMLPDVAFALRGKATQLFDRYFK